MLISFIHFIGIFLILCGLIALNAFFVAAEMALARIRRTRVDHLVEEGNRTAKLMQEELDNFDRFISACQLGITLATLALGATGEATFAGDIAKAVNLQSMGVPESMTAQVMPVVRGGIYVLSFTVTAFLQTVFGELVPKVYTMERAESVLTILIYPMRWWIFITTPFLKVLSKFTELVFRLLQIKDPPRRHFVHSGEELRMLVSASHEEGVLEEKEEEMLHSVFDFADTIASEVMTPRTDMICAAADATVEEFVQLALQHGHSRLPVYEEDIDSIFGAVHIRDALRALIEHKGQSKIRELTRKILIVPENKDAGDLLTEFKKTKTHMAIVVDEYGATRGLVTIEDLLEELVGDIADEHEIVEEYVEKVADGIYVIDARASLDEINDYCALDIQDEEFNTIGGHVFGLLGREPKVGDEVCEESWTMRVEEADRHRILKVKLSVREAAHTQATSNGAVVGAVENSETSPAKPISSSK